MERDTHSENAARLVLAKYLRKGNMARSLRDVLPRSSLSKEQRRLAADIVHKVVRWRRLYEAVLARQGQEPTGENLVLLATGDAERQADDLPLELRASCSPYVARVLENHPAWADYLNSEPPTTLCVNENKATVDAVRKRLEMEAVPSEPGRIRTAVLTAHSEAKYSSVVTESLAHIQDESSQLIALLACSAGERIFDYCAGNGGKTLAMASLGRNGKQVVAFETDEGRRQTLARRCAQYGAQVVVEPAPPHQTFDVVLVDAPCTGLGAARRNPEAKYIDGVGTFPDIQLSVLHEAAQFVASGGLLLYAVCTFTSAETTEVITSFITQRSFAIADLSAFPGGEFLQRRDNGFLTAVPNGDLFYVAALKQA